MESDRTMATHHVRKQVNQLIRLAALAMLVLGLLVTIAPFKIQYHNREIDYDDDGRSWDNRRSGCEINIPKIYDQYWSGFLIFSIAIQWWYLPPNGVEFVACKPKIILTSVLTLVTYHAKLPNWPPRVKVIPHQKVYCTVFILMTMISALAVMTQEEEPFGRVRNYNEKYDCDDPYHHKGKNRYHRSKMLSWFYVLLVSSNILVVGCLVQFMAFFVIWILNVIEGTDPEEDHVEQQHHHQQQQRWYMTEGQGQVNHAMEPLLPALQTDAPYPATSTNEHHPCCTIEKSQLPSAADPPPTYATVQSEGNISDISGSSRPHAFPTHVDLPTEQS